jgi:hypothetical protein
MESCMERTSGLEDILVRHMPCNRNGSHPRNLTSSVCENTVSGVTASKITCCVTDDASFG